MIKKCNFKNIDNGCSIKDDEFVCSGEENCILYQTYKNTLPKPRVARAKTPKKKKPLAKTKDGKYRNPNRAIKRGIKEIIKQERDKK